MTGPGGEASPAPGRAQDGGTALAHRRWVAGIILAAGFVLAGVGLATFHAPTCTGGSATMPATCSAWETSQWLMIGGVLLAVPALLYLAYAKMQERIEAERTRGTTEGASPPK